MFIFPTLKSLSAGLADASVSNTARNHDLKESCSEGTLSYDLVSELKEVIAKLHRSYLND